MAADKSIKALINHMEGAITSFQKDIPAVQKGVMDSLVSQLKDLQTQDGKILNSVQNLKLINSLKNKLERLIISEGYKDKVKQYVEAFDTVESLQKQYFAAFNFKFKPKKTLPIIKEMAVDKTLNDLLGQGLQSNVVDRIHSILQDNVTSGGSYASLNEQLRSTIVGGEEHEGLLERYSRTITTDSINQYSAQYHEALAVDLNFSWGRYIGSNLTTTREFCILLEEKEWVHRSELPAIIEGKIDGHQCKLSKSTGLPLGMIPGTNADNFKIRRGGYNCGHQFFWTPDSAVPENVKNRLTNKPATYTAPVEKINKASLSSLAKRDIVFPQEVLKLLPEDLKIVDKKDGGSFYNPTEKTLTIGGRERANNEYYQKKIVLHEGGHAIHFEKGIITFDKVDKSFRDFYGQAKRAIDGKEAEIDDLLWSTGLENNSDITKLEQIAILHDTLGGLTKGKYGAGHSRAYYENGNYSLMEVFAHSITLARLDNEFIDLHPALSELVKLMKGYGSKILEGK